MFQDKEAKKSSFKGKVSTFNKINGRSLKGGNGGRRRRL